MRRRIELDDEWRAKIARRDTGTLARTISAIERDPQFLLAICERIFAENASASLGITGPPGAGKSTLINRVIADYRRRGMTVAVLAIDPSSVATGGAVLGDRLRMQDHALDDSVFVRSLSTKGHLGGVSQSTFVIAQLLKYAGFDRVLIETVGIGQNELEIVSVADITSIVLIPGMGDQIQAIKSGIMEVGDLFVLNKKDHPGIRTLQRIIGEEAHARENKSGTELPVRLTNAVSGEGVAELVDTCETLLERRPGPLREQRIREQREAFARSLLDAYISNNIRRPFYDSEQYRAFERAFDDTAAGPAGIVAAFENYIRGKERSG